MGVNLKHINEPARIFFIVCVERPLGNHPEWKQKHIWRKNDAFQGEIFRAQQATIYQLK